MQMKDVFNKLEVLSSGVIQVRIEKIIEDENGNKIASSGHHRHCIVPGDDYSQELPHVQALCQAIHTPEKIEEYLDSIEK